jgi:hypothetical protein
MAQTPVQHCLPRLLDLIQEGKINPSFVITHQAPLADGPELYKTFRDKKDGCIKVMLRPSAGLIALGIPEQNGGLPSYAVQALTLAEDARDRQATTWPV